MHVSEANRIAFDGLTDKFDELTLQRPEQQLLARHAGRWHELRMLDLGIGTGRTSYTFAPIAGRYVGIDYAPRMIDAARELIEPSESITLQVADARHLTEEVGGEFDLVLFSFNGIDYVDLPDRELILRQSFEMLAPGGELLFSTHSTAGLPLPLPRPRVDPRNPARTAVRLVQAAREVRRVRKANARLDLESLVEEGGGMVQDGAYHSRLEVFYVVPERQAEQLEQLGYEQVRVIDRSGREVSPSDPGPDPWLFYSARRPEQPAG